MSSEEEGESLSQGRSWEGKSCALANWNIPNPHLLSKQLYLWGEYYYYPYPYPYYPWGYYGYYGPWWRYPYW